MLDKTWIKKPSNVFIHLWYIGLPRNRELFHSITAKPIHMPQWIRFWLCNTFDFFLCKIQSTGLAGKYYILHSAKVHSSFLSKNILFILLWYAARGLFQGLCVPRVCSYLFSVYLTSSNMTPILVVIIF